MSFNGDELEHGLREILADKSLVSNLQAAEAAALADWAAAELSPDAGQRAGTPAERVAQVQAAVKEINDLVGNKMALVSDDIEERMAMLLVGDLDAGAQVRLQIEREIAQVTAEKDHLDNIELVRQLTALASQAWQSKAAHASEAVPLAPRAAATAQVKPLLDESRAGALSLQGAPSQAASAAQRRPIPRPTPIPRKQRGWFHRLFGGG